MYALQAYLPMTCDECQGEVHLITSVASFGGSAGARFFQCQSCGRLQIEDLSSPLTPGSQGMNFRPQGA